MVHSPQSTAHRLALSIISAILLILTYPNFNLHFLAWVALVPLFFALENQNSKKRFVLGYVFGTIFFAGILYWLANVTVLGMVAAVILLSFIPAVFASLCPSSLVPRPSSIVAVPSAWVLSEYLRTYYLTGFPWVLLGYSQSFNLNIIQIADITGPYGVSFLIVFVNLGVYLTLRKAPKRFYTLFLIFLVFTLVWAYGDNRLKRTYPTQKLKVSVIQGNIPQELKWDERYRNYTLNKYKSLTVEAVKENPKLVIWPESAVPGYLEGENDLKDKILNLAKSQNVHLLLGTLREEEGEFFNSAAFISDSGEIVGGYDKIHLVPFGEYVPFRNLFLWIRPFIDKPIGDFMPGKEFKVFKFKLTETSRKASEIRKSTEFHSFSALICFEDIFPNLCRRFVKDGARFLVNITNDAWFGKSPAAYQHMQNSIFRAVENKVPVLRAANTGVSCIIDHRGKVVKTVNAGKEEIFVDGYATDVIEPTFSNTIYTRYGDIFSWICISLVIVSIGVRRLRHV